jgi:branched-chain amino acid transport system substrate-binding protein
MCTVPNYQAGKDSVAGFKLVTREIVRETYMPLGTLDFQVELSRWRRSSPMPCYLHAGHGRKPGETVQAGRPRPIKFGPFGVHGDGRCRRNEDAAIGMLAARTGLNLDNPQNKNSSPAMGPPTTACPAPTPSGL